MCEWIHPDDDKPRRGEKLIMRHRNGCIAIGEWGEGMVMYIRPPKYTPEQRARLTEEGKI